MTKLLTYFAQACHDLVPPEVSEDENLNSLCISYIMPSYMYSGSAYGQDEGNPVF